jgi:hypothetical protein
MIGIKLIAVTTAAGTVLGAAQIVDQQTLLPFSLFAGGIVGACVLGWKAALYVGELKALRERVQSLEALLGVQRTAGGRGAGEGGGKS